MTLKKIYKFTITFIVVLAVIIGSMLIYTNHKKEVIEKEVIEYVSKEKQLDKKDIDGKAFLSNLPGDKRYCVNIKIKGDANLYTYYRTKDNKIKLESYIDANQIEHVVE